MKTFLFPLAMIVSFVSAAAPLETCELKSTEPILEAALTEALTGVFRLNGEVLKKETLKFEIVQLSTGIDALKVEFLSPRGTPMSLRSGYDSFNGVEKLDAFVFGFSVAKLRDTDGFLVAKACKISPYFRYKNIDYSPKILNEVNGAIAPISNNFYKPDSSLSSPMMMVEILTQRLEMTLRE